MTLESLVREIRSTPLPHGVITRIIAIDGHGGSGKTTLAAKLSRLLNAPVVHTDDFASLNKAPNWWRRIDYQVLDPLSKNETAHYQKYDWDKDELGEWLELKPQDFVILEGVSSSRQEFTKYLAYTVWVEAPKEICFERGLERDGQDSLPNWEKWWQEELDYIAEHDPQDRADATIDGTKELT